MVAKLRLIHELHSVPRHTLAWDDLMTECEKIKISTRGSNKD